MSEWTHFHDLFWTLLAPRLATDVADARQRADAFEWLTKAVLAPERSGTRREAVRALENGIVGLLSYGQEQHLEAPEMRQYVLRLLIPLLQSRLINEIDPTMRRLVGYLFRLPDEGRAATLYSLQGENVPSIDFQITEQEEEKAMLEALVQVRESGHNSVELRLGVARTAIPRTVPGIEYQVRLEIEVPLVHMLLTDLDTLPPDIFDEILAAFTFADPIFAERLSDLRLQLLSHSVTERRKGMRLLCLAYLTSWYYSLKRDMAHAVSKLQDCPLAEVDRLCRLPPLPHQYEAPALLEALIQEQQTGMSSIPEGVPYLLFLLSPPALGGAFPNLADAWEKRGQEAEENGLSRQAALQGLCEGIIQTASIYGALAKFCYLLAIGMKDAEQTVDWNESSLLVREWIREYIVFMLSCSPDHSSDQTEDRVFFCSCDAEGMRRQVYAACLQAGMSIAASPRHVRELWAQHHDRERIIAAWLWRGIVLAERLLLVLINSFSGLKTIRSEAERLQQLSKSVDADAYPDLFNPFLFGAQGYDHVAAGLLAVLETVWESTIDADSDGRLPFWWSEDVQQTLVEFSARPETDAETRWCAARDQGKPNRLKLNLDRTPKEFARDLLARAQECNTI